MRQATEDDAFRCRTATRIALYGCTDSASCRGDLRRLRDQKDVALATLSGLVFDYQCTAMRITW